MRSNYDSVIKARLKFKPQIIGKWDKNLVKFDKQKDRKFQPYPLNEKRFEIMQLPSIHVQGMVSMDRQTSDRNFEKSLVRGIEGFTHSKPFYDSKIQGKCEFAATIRNPNQSMSQQRLVDQSDIFKKRMLKLRQGLSNQSSQQ